MVFSSFVLATTVATLIKGKRGKHEVLGNPTVFKAHSGGRIPAEYVVKQEVPEEGEQLLLSLDVVKQEVPEVEQEELEKEKILVEGNKALEGVRKRVETAVSLVSKHENSLDEMDEVEKSKHKKNLVVANCRAKKLKKEVEDLKAALAKAKSGTIADLQLILQKTKESKKKNNNEKKKGLNQEKVLLAMNENCPDDLSEEEKQKIDKIIERKEKEKMKFTNRSIEKVENDKQRSKDWYYIGNNKKNHLKRVKQNYRKKKALAEQTGKVAARGRGGSGGKGKETAQESEEEDDPSEELGEAPLPGGSGRGSGGRVGEDLEKKESDLEEAGPTIKMEEGSDETLEGGSGGGGQFLEAEEDMTDADCGELFEDLEFKIEIDENLCDRV